MTIPVRDIFSLEMRNQELNNILIVKPFVILRPLLEHTPKNDISVALFTETNKKNRDNRAILGS